MSEEIFMDVPAVRKVATRFGEMGETLQGVNKAMEAAIATLKASAFVGLFGNFAYAQYLEQLQPIVEDYADKCVEMSGDLLAAAKAYQDGDAAGAKKFH